MRTDLTEMEHHTLFLAPIRNLKFEIEELNKMLDSRIDILTKNLCDGDLCSSPKTLKTEVFRAIEGANALCQKTYKGLIENLEKSFHKIEEIDEEKA